MEKKERLQIMVSQLNRELAIFERTILITSSVSSEYICITVCDANQSVPSTFLKRISRIACTPQVSISYNCLEFTCYPFLFDE